MDRSSTVNRLPSQPRNKAKYWSIQWTYRSLLTAFSAAGQLSRTPTKCS